jgi:KUP system potassium uptake protein
LAKIPHGAWTTLLVALVTMVFMLFWTWAKRLEDRFDGTNRRNLRHFIISGEKGEEVALPLGAPQPIISDADDVTEAESVQQSYYYYARDRTTADPVERDEDRRELVRIPTCAVFHKFASGKGVPHSFVGFIRQWPALPQVVIFLSVCILPTPRVSPDERYDVNKVRSVRGFYGVTYYIGFREDFQVSIDEIVARIYSLESPEDRKSFEAIGEIRRAVLQTTHIVPHYHVMSKVDVRDGGILHVPFNWIRKFLIESIYRRLIISFPETAKWTGPADDIIRVGITARI